MTGKHAAPSTHSYWDEVVAVLGFLAALVVLFFVIWGVAIPYTNIPQPGRGYTFAVPSHAPSLPRPSTSHSGPGKGSLSDSGSSSPNKGRRTRAQGHSAPTFIFGPGQHRPPTRAHTPRSSSSSHVPVSSTSVPNRTPRPHPSTSTPLLPPITLPPIPLPLPSLVPRIVVPSLPLVGTGLELNLVRTCAHSHPVIRLALHHEPGSHHEAQPHRGRPHQGHAQRDRC